METLSREFLCLPFFVLEIFMNERYIKRSEITGRNYDLFQCVKILNISQAIFYLNHNVKLMDLQISKDKQDKDILVFVFKKSDTKDAYDLWCKRGD